MSKCPPPKWYWDRTEKNMFELWIGSSLYNKIAEVLEDNDLLIHSYISMAPWRDSPLETNKYCLGDDMTMGFPIKSDLSSNLFIRAFVIRNGSLNCFSLRCFGYIKQKRIIRFTIKYGKRFESHLIKKLREFIERANLYQIKENKKKGKE